MVSLNCEGVQTLDDLDLLAMLAMVGLLSNDGYSRRVVQMAYDIAEEMVEEKEKRHEQTN